MNVRCFGFLCEGLLVFSPHNSYEKIYTIKPAYLHLKIMFVIYRCVSSTNPPSVQKLSISAVVFVVEGIWTAV